MYANLLHHPKMVRLVMVAVLLMLAVMGCRPASPATTAPEDTQAPVAPTEMAAPAVPAPTKITIALNSDVNTLDSHKTGSVGTDQSIISHIYSSLIIRGPDLELQPSAAESWETVNETTWRFKLREGITYPNGEKLDANTVKWNLDRVRDPETAARLKSWFDPVIEVNVIDETTVEMVTDGPYPVLADQLSMLFMLAPEWSATHDPAAEAMGTGPYELVEWVKDDHITLEARPDYWGDPPPFQTVVFRPVPEASSRIAGLLAGDYDIITGVPPSDLERINADGCCTAGATPSTRTAMVKFNTLKEPMDNVLVRQALNYAVDKDSLIKNLLEGETVKSNGQVLTPDYFGYNPNLEPYPYDPEQAKALLAEAGYADGFEAELDVPAGTYLLGEQIVQAVAEQLRAVGVTVNINEMPFSVYMDKYLKERDLAQLAYITYAWPTIDADGILGLFESGNQYAYWDNEVFSQALKDGRSTMDPAKRQEFYDIATTEMREQAPVIFLFPQPAMYAVRNTIDWQARPDDWVRAIDIGIKQ
jgi:peptide/nickel transport system substrate-binding protein